MSCWGCSLLEENISSHLEWRALEGDSRGGLGANKVTPDLLCGCVRRSRSHAVFHFISALTEANTPKHMHAVLVPAPSVCCCGYKPDCSYHGSACSIHQKQADRERGSGRHWNTCSWGDTGSTYLLQGHEHRPQNCPRLFKFFSASFMSLLIWSIPSSIRSSCSDYQHIVIFPRKRMKAHKKRRKEEIVGGGLKERREIERRNKGEETKKRHWLWQERHQTSPSPPPPPPSPAPALDRQELSTPDRYLLFNTWAYQTTALSYIF